MISKMNKFLSLFQIKSSKSLEILYSALGIKKNISNICAFIRRFCHNKGKIRSTYQSISFKTSSTITKQKQQQQQQNHDVNVF